MCILSACNDGLSWRWVLSEHQWQLDSRIGKPMDFRLHETCSMLCMMPSLSAALPNR